MRIRINNERMFEFVLLYFCVALRVNKFTLMSEVLCRNYISPFSFSSDGCYVKYSTEGDNEISDILSRLYFRGKPRNKRYETTIPKDMFRDTDSLKKAMENTDFVNQLRLEYNMLFPSYEDRNYISMYRTSSCDNIAVIILSYPKILEALQNNMIDFVYLFLKIYCQSSLSGINGYVEKMLSHANNKGKIDIKRLLDSFSKIKEEFCESEAMLSALKEHSYDMKSNLMFKWGV